MNIFIIIMLNIFNAFLLVSMDTAVSLVYNMFSGLELKSMANWVNCGWFLNTYIPMLFDSETI